jgi:hypothetical protein
MTASKHSLILTGALSLALLIMLPTPAVAARIVVGDGTAPSCTESALRDALLIAETLDSGYVVFRCGADPVTIILTSTLNPRGRTTIDGGGLVTLRGETTDPVGAPAGSVMLIFVASGSTVALKELTLINGGAQLVYAVGNEGVLTVKSSVVRDNLTWVAASLIAAC